MDGNDQPRRDKSGVGVCMMTALGLMLLSGHGLAQEPPGGASLELKLEVGKTLAQDGIHRFANHGPTIEGRDNDTD